VWQTYKDDGLVVWGMAGQDESVDNLVYFRDALGISFPILVDPGGRVYAEYEVLNRFPTAAYPADYIIDSAGVVAYVSNGYEPDEWLPILEEELGL